MNTKAVLSIAILAATASIAPAARATAVQSVSGVTVAASEIERTDTRLNINSTLDISNLGRMKSNRELWLTPVLYSNETADSIALPAICVAGHNRYITLLRRGGTTATSGTLYRAGRQATVPVSASLPWQQWMESSHITYLAMECGCCDEPIALIPIPGDTIDYVPRFFEVAEWAYITPPREVKTRAVSGSAYIDFPVNRTELYPDYRRNPEELRSIQATIDVVRNDSDIVIDSLSVVGYASPEGPWNNNVRLAAGRTTTLIEYIRDLYSFSNDILRKNSVPEDWAGLLKRLELTDIANRDAIMAIAADNSIEPDARNTRIQRRFPVQYAWILKNIYPALRHSDYTVYYTVVDFTDPAVIGQVLVTAPQKLSLGEIFTYANTLDPDSREFREVFEVAVRMFPDNVIANVNAANTALRQGDYEAAENYLKTAGDLPEANYLRGVSAALREDYTTALPYFRKAASAGFAAADKAIQQMHDKRLITE